MKVLTYIGTYYIFQLSPSQPDCARWVPSKLDTDVLFTAVVMCTNQLMKGA